MFVPILCVLLGGSVVIAHPSGSNDACATSPCGRNANCETTLSGLAVCKCPENYSGDAFVACLPNSHTAGNTGVNPTFATMPTRQPSPTTEFHSSTPNRPHSNPTIPSQQFTVDFKVESDDSSSFSRVPILGPSSFQTSVIPLHNRPMRPTMIENPNNGGGGSGGHHRFPISVTVTSETHASHPGSFNIQQNPPLLDSRPLPSIHRPNDQSHYYPTSPPSGIYKHQNLINSVTKDPMGQYSDCRTVNGIVVCADNSVDDTPTGGNGHNIFDTMRDSPYHHHVNLHGQNNQNQFQSNYPHPHQDNNNNRYPQIQTGPTSATHHWQEVPGKFVTQQKGFKDPIPSMSDNGELCKSVCGQNSICKMINNRPVCGNLVDKSSTTQSPADKCERHTDCDAKEICALSKCVDPCSDKFQMGNGESRHNGGMCGQNAKCLVVEHTPLCSCNQNYYGNPYMACVA